MGDMGRCVWPNCAHAGMIVPLPLTGERLRLCDRHRGPRFIAHMRRLVPK